MAQEFSPEDHNFFDPVTPGSWITGPDGVFTEGTIDETLRAEADNGEQHFTPPEPGEVVYEGFIDAEGNVRYVREDVAEAAAQEPYAVVAPIPGALLMDGEPLPREITTKRKDAKK